MKIGRAYASVVAIPLLAMTAVGIVQPPVLADVRNFVFDTYQRLMPRKPGADRPVRIINIDEESLRRIGQWPWPRNRMGELTHRLTEAGAAAIAFDMTFAEPDRLSLENIALAVTDPALREALAKDIARAEPNDVGFAAEIAKSPVVLGGVLINEKIPPPTTPQKFGFAAAGDDPMEFIPEFAGAVLPLPSLVAAARGVGAFNWLPDRDQVVRKVPLFLSSGGRIYPGLAMEALRVAQGASTYVVKSSNASGQTAFGAKTGINTVKIGAYEIATGPNGDVRVHFSAHDPGRFIPAWKVLTGKLEKPEVDGRIVLVGIGAAGLLDQRATPIDASVPGVEVHAQLIEFVLQGAQLVRPDWAPAIELFIGTLLGIALVIALPLAAPLIGALLGAIGVALLIGASWWAFVRHGVLLDPLFPAVSSGIAYMAGVVMLFRAERTAKAMVRNAMGRFVPPAIVERLAESPEKLVLGGESRELTLMFCDLRDFTSLSENFDAEGIIRFMNEYLTPMTNTIHANGGTVDKYMGDAIMAFWNAPLDDPRHAAHAARASLAMIDELDAFNLRRATGQKQAAHTFVRARFGIGLNTGMCAVGNLGSEQRFDYSAIGDPVNVASRLEGTTKLYGVPVIAAEVTRQAAPDFAWLELDRVRVKGRGAVTRIFALVGEADFAVSPEFFAWQEVHNAMLEDFRASRFEEAQARAAKASALARQPWRESYAIYFDRFEKMKVSPPPRNWDGVRTLSEK